MARTDNSSARKKNFYHEQRVHAEETGNQGEVNKIYGKLHEKAPQVGGSDRVDKALLGLPFAAIGAGAGAPLEEGAAASGNLLSHLGAAVLKRFFPEAEGQINSHLAAATGHGGEELAQGMIPKALEGAGRKALPRGRAALPRGSAASRTKPLVKARTVERVTKEKNVTPRKPIAQSPPKALSKPKSDLAKTYKQPSKVTAGKPRAKQTAPRAKGTNPRATGTNKRSRRKGSE